MKRVIFFLLLLVNISCSYNSKTRLAIIPKPNKTLKQSGQFTLNTHVYIQNQIEKKSFINSIVVFQKMVFEKTNLKLKVNVGTDKKSKAIILKLNDTFSAEQYLLNISNNEILIEGGDEAGLFYGMMSLYQQIKKQRKYYSVSAFIIEDQPAFKWRGLHLDVSRHFFSVQEIKKILSAMALLKLNTFHWHLTDDQGWRIEIKKYPKLTTIGSSRKETLVGHAANWPETYDNEEVKGFYTQKEIKEIVEYASAHQINIIPEIEMPGHAVAALAAYPEFACTQGPFEVWTKWGVNPEVFCAGNENTYLFLEDILDEVCDLFPGEYIHIGGDECPKERWKHCRKCQAKITEENLQNTEELQGYFTKRMEAYLFTKGKKTVGWDEILDGGVPSRAIIMSWRGEEGGIAAAMAGNDVVMAPNDYVYFDHYQDVLYEPLAIAGLTRMKEVYDFNPVPENMISKQEHILGAQAQLWTEYIKNNSHLEYMIFPRLLALSEALWTQQENKNYIDFQTRLSNWYPNLDLLKLNYRIDYPHGFNKMNKTLKDRFKVKLSSENSDAAIYYTINGFEPDAQSMKYSNEIQLIMPEDSLLKAIAILPNGKKSKVHQGIFIKEEPIEAISLNNARQGVHYQYYKGEFLSASSIDTSMKSTTGSINQIRIPDENDGDFFAIIYSGYIKIPDDNLYTFYLYSDDGSILNISGKEIINNDGFHYGFEKSGQIALKAGYHPFEIKYLQGNYGGELKLQWSVNGDDKKEIPSNYLYNFN